VDGEVYSVENFIPAEADKRLEKAAAKAIGGDIFTKYANSTNWRVREAAQSQQDAMELGWHQ